MKNGFHVNKITAQTFITLCNIKGIRRYLNRDITKTIIQVLVMSKIDYWNSLLDGSAQYQIQNIQRNQNVACQVICNLKKHDHVTDSMKDLHLLRVPERIKYNIAVIMFKIVRGNAPEYLTELIQKKTHSRCLCSTSDLKDLVPAFYRNGQAANSALHSSGARILLNLPKHLHDKINIDVFKKNHKTNPFQQSYR